MELWVRTQHKTSLIKSSGVYFKEEHRDFTDGSKVKYCLYDWSSDEVVSTYDTKERCLEILDEIQKILMSDPLPLLVFTNCDVAEDTYDGLNEMYKKGDLLALCSPSLQGDVRVIEKSTVVYEMPEK